MEEVGRILGFQLSTNPTESFSALIDVEYDLPTQAKESGVFMVDLEKLSQPHNE